MASRPACVALLAFASALFVASGAAAADTLLPGRESRVRFQELEAIVGGWCGAGTLVLVTHGFIISPLLRARLEQAETLVLRPGGRGETVADIVSTIPAPQ